ncbi:hypothetical protein Gpo141_00013259 [Globisporangium polare]
MFEQAQCLLREHLQPLVKADLHNSMLFLVDRGGTSSGHFVPQETWINANVGGATGLELQQLRTCMEVISQLSQSDYFQWREFYHSFWKPELMSHLGCSECSTSLDGNADPTQYDDVEELTRSKGPRFILDCTDVKDGGDTFKLLTDFLFMDIEEALGEKHGAVLAELTSQGRRPTSLPELTDRPACKLDSTRDEAPQIELGLAFSSAGLTIAANFRALATLLDELADHAQKKKNAARYKVTTLWIPAAKSLAPVEIDLLIDIIASETSTVRHLHIANALMMLLVAKRLQVFQQLLRTTVCSLPDCESTLKTLHLKDVPLVHPPVASICSALRYPNSLRDLHLQWATPETAGAPAGGDIKLMWAWIAFGIFHPDSKAKLDRLNLSGLPLKPDDLATFASILRSPHSGRQLWMLEFRDLPQGEGLEEIPMPANQRMFVQLTVDTKVRVSPKARAKALEPVALESDEFEVIIELATWVCVVVPGCGFGWVSSSSIESRREEPSKCPVLHDSSAEVAGSESDNWPLAGANVKSFDRNRVGEIDQLESIKLLLRMIGRGLQKISFPSHALVITDADLAEILDCCPKLTHLNLIRNTLTSLAPLIDRFRSRQCRIAYLNIQTADTQTQIFCQLLESPFSKPLRYVAVNGMAESAGCLRELAGALKSNTSLQLLYFYSANREERMLMAYMQASFQDSPGDSQLLLGTKIAFLSAIQAHSTKSLGELLGSTTSSLGKLDSSIASQIFAFAAVRIPRTFYW